MATELNTMKRGQPVIVSQKAEKNKKVLHFGAFWCVACAPIRGRHNMWCSIHSLEGCATGENAKFVAFCCIDRHIAGGAEKKFQKVMQNDAFWCMASAPPLKSGEISGVSNSNDASFADQKMVRLMHCVA